MNKNYSPATKCIHSGYEPANGEPLALPIYQSTTYSYSSPTEIGKLSTEYHEHKMYIIEWDIGTECGFNHYTTGFIPYNLEEYKGWIEKYGLNK